MRKCDPAQAVQVLDLLLDFFADGARWLQGAYTDRDARRCLVGALHYVHRRHCLPTELASDLLQQEMPHRSDSLVYFNDSRCRHFADLRSVIIKARGLALEQGERERSAEAVKRWLLAEIEKERAARAAAGDMGETNILCPRTPGETAVAPLRLAA
jgi:hypothetical protein